MRSRKRSNGTGNDGIATKRLPNYASFESLTPREREIMALVTAGLMNKQVAGELGLSEITVKIHRGHIMRKMGVRSLADLVRAAEALELHRPAQSTPQTSA